MYTLVDFTTRVKGVEYLIAITAIASFILFSEILKAKPFKSLMDAIREDVKYVKENGLSLAKLMAAPLTGLIYVMSLPFNFAFALATTVKNGFLKMAGGNATFFWHPTELTYSARRRPKRGMLIGASGQRRSDVSAAGGRRRDQRPSPECTLRRNG